MLRKMHRVSACVISAYVLIHLINHFVALDGPAAHYAFMQAYRHVYRQPLLEALLLACFAFQACSGLWLVARRWGERQGFYDRLQAVSGAYLAFFILAHLGAVLYARARFGLDTNFYFAAAGLHIAPFQAFFMPYYFLAISALFAHLACAFHYLCRERIAAFPRNAIASTIIGAGLLSGGLIVAAFSGAFYPIDIPLRYRAIFL